MIYFIDLIVLVADDVRLTEEMLNESTKEIGLTKNKL